MGSLFGGNDTPTPMPIPEAPRATPMVDDAAIARKKKKLIAANQQRGGRQSTILSDLGSSETLG